MLDIVIGGPDFSGTSTQIQDAVDYFLAEGLTARDMRRSDVDALFHADRFDKYNAGRFNLEEFLNDMGVGGATKLRLMWELSMEIRDMRVASFVKNDWTNYADPKKADVWVFEEPTKRGSGVYCRVFEQNRADFGADKDPRAEAHSHADYRVFEYHLYRGPIRSVDGIVLRSRSEESRVYQEEHDILLPGGISGVEYVGLPGHEVAYAFPPTHILIGHGPEDWDRDEYIAFRKERSGDRLMDGFEKDVDRQLMVNARYAQDGWLEAAYRQACAQHGGGVPQIIRFDARMPMKDIRAFIHDTLANIT